MDRQIYEAPGLTVLGSVAELTEGKSSGTSDQTGVDGNNSFTPPPAA